ncbi:MAG: orotate phosphoribosyltransferase [Brevinematia bacterium]
MNKEEFIKFLIESDVLKFGEFTTKSGRKTPYFINTGNYDDGRKLSILGEFYAEVVYRNFEGLTSIFGPAYKGISLAVVTSIKIYDKYGISVKCSFNRKELKDHGEGGIIVGHKFSEDDKVVIVEDVITSGISIRESMEILKSNGNPKVLGVVVSVDRMERGKEKLATEEIKEEFGINVISIVKVVDIIEFLKKNNYDINFVKKMEEYLGF